MENKIFLRDVSNDLFKIKDLNFVSNSDIKVLYHLGYWDGYLSGICVYNNIPHYFTCIKEYIYTNSNNRIFAILKLDLEQYVTIEQRHIKFDNYVGFHTNYDSNGKNLEMRPKNTILYSLSSELRKRYFDKFYAEAKLENKIDFSNNEVVGYFNFYCDNPQNLLISLLKEEICELSYKQKILKRKRKKDHIKYAESCFSGKRKLRNHYIAYALLRNKDYNSIERKSKLKYYKSIKSLLYTDMFYYNLKHKNTNGSIVEICKNYSITPEQYTPELIKNILTPPEDLKDVSHV